MHPMSTLPRYPVQDIGDPPVKLRHSHRLEFGIAKESAVRVLVILFVLFSPVALSAQPLSPEAVPEPLEPWIDWVLHERTDFACPVRHGEDRRDCVWPGELSIDATSAGAIFDQTVTVYRKSRVRLPGDLQAWPNAVYADQAAMPVIDQAGVPVIELPPGEYRIRGVIDWQVMPTAIAVAPQIGIVRYRRDGAEVRLPQLRDGRLWLRNDIAGAAKAPEDSLSMEVYRLVEDGHPARLVTHLALEVSGRQRELVLGSPLLEGLLPLRLESGLPVRLEPDGGLRVQVRPGRWTVRVHARHPADFTRLQLRSQPEPWPGDEVWVLRTSPRDRLVDVEGLRQIDPRQVDLPQDWGQLPAYRMSAPQDFLLDVIRRGDPQPEPDRLALQRDLWLDFDGAGYTVRDRISGRMTHGWRLSVDESLELGRVTIDGQPQFITRLAEETRDGVEVRRGQLDLVAESRYAVAIDDLPAVGWGRDFQQVSADLHLPPGWRLFAVSGVDNVPASWVQRWTLYDVFLVLIVTVAVGRLWGWRWSPVALLTLLLVWHEPQAPRMTWLYLLAVIALLRVVPAEGRIYGALKFARLAGLAVLLLIILPFMVEQARQGLYPQLERHLAVPAASTATTVEFQAYEAEPASSPRQIAEGVADAMSSRLAPDRLLEKVAAPPGGRSRALDQVDPSATIQTGPGLPDWRWSSARLTWNGPVAADQRIAIYLLGPTSHLVLNFVTMGLVLLLAWRFLDLGRRNGGWRKGLLLLLCLAAASGNASATAFPPPDMLEELERRLTAVPTEAPRATIHDMVVSLGPDHYLASFTVHALQRTSIPLPVDTSLTTPVRVSLDGSDRQPPLYRSEDNQLWLLAPEGVHRVELEVFLPALNQVQIPLPLRPRRVQTGGEGWTVEGIDRNGVPQQQLSLVRIRATGAGADDELAPSVLPPFLRVERTIHFGIQWEIHTRVLRESPLGTSLSVQIPIVPGASVTSDGLPVKDGRVLVTMAADQREVGWRSRLDPAETLTLTAARTDQWLEAWFADIGPVWHVTTEGIPPVHHQDAGRNWLPGWHPWPGEQLTFRVQRPAGVDGRTVTIDQSHLVVEPGKRATDTTLSFRLRASQGGRHELVLPQGALLQSVTIDGRTQPIRQQDREVSLPVMPGVQHYELSWRQMSGIQAHWQTPAIALGGDSVNASLTVHAPRDRWTLWLSGPRLGPAVLFWGVLGVIVVAALVLARVGAGYLPVGLASWLLLGIGLTQVSVLGMLVLVGWFFLVHYRSTLSADTPRGLFNSVQLLIVALSVVAFSILTWAVQTGLLGLPTMQIEGNGSSAYRLNWYQDRVSEQYPQATIVSVPLFVYRALMMAWALWLAYSLLKWIAWAWAAVSRGGLWRSVRFSLDRFKTTKKARATGNDEAGGGTVG
jgi:hypothetical protein